MDLNFNAEIGFEFLKLLRSNIDHTKYSSMYDCRVAHLIHLSLYSKHKQVIVILDINTGRISLYCYDIAYDGATTFIDSTTKSIQEYDLVDHNSLDNITNIVNTHLSEGY